MIAAHQAGGGYTRIQIALHWAIVLLVAVQLFSHEAMEHFFDRVEDGLVTGPPTDAGSLTHVFGGLAILLLMLVRIVVRLRRGAPDLPPDTSAAVRAGAKASHFALYALLIVIPLAGIVAVASGSESAGDLHGTLVTLLWVVLGLHVAGALYHALIRRDGVFKRIFVPEP